MRENQPIYSVSEITNHLKAVIENDPHLNDIWIVGEISNLSFPSSGHVYFTLKDEAASLRCVIWKWQAQYLQAGLREGDSVEAHGSFGIYERAGNYQFYVNALGPAGEGALYQQFLRLKAQLEAQGFFEAERKRPIPVYPQIIGIVTSPTSAALQDMLNTLQERYPVAEVVLSPTMVQGEEAPALIAAAIQRLNVEIQPDVILLARGGGSLEDLWSFNEEQVVRAIVASKAPVISGVGHETDFTLADFAADVRAPTPTAAAVLATPHMQELKGEVKNMQQMLINTMTANLQLKRQHLRERAYSLQQKSPRWQLRQHLQHLDELSNQLSVLMRHTLQVYRTRVESTQGRMQALNPQAVLGRGYALVSDGMGILLNSISNVQLGMRVDVQLQDGKFGAGVQTIEEKKTIG